MKFIKSIVFPIAGRTKKPFSTQIFNEAEEKIRMEHDKKLAIMWRKITFYIGIPACILSGMYVVYLGEEHIHFNNNYDHLRVRRKPFPFYDGDKTLFWNEDVNH